MPDPLVRPERLREEPLGRLPGVRDDRPVAEERPRPGERADELPVDVGVEGAVDRGARTSRAHGPQLRDRRIERAAGRLRRVDPLGRVRERQHPEQHVAVGVVGHAAVRPDPEEPREEPELGRVERLLELGPRPREVSAVVPGPVVGVLARPEPPRRVGEHPPHPADRRANHLLEPVVREPGGPFHVRGDHRRVVDAHLLEMRDVPALVNRVPVESAADLVVHAPVGHPQKGLPGAGGALWGPPLEPGPEEERDGCRVRELRGQSETTVHRVEARVHLAFHAHHEPVEGGIARGALLPHPLERTLDRPCVLPHALGLLVPQPRDLLQHATEPRSAVAVGRGEVGPAEEHLAVRREEPRAASRPPR